MKRVEFEALLKIQDRYLLMCTVRRAIGDKEEHLFAADVEDRRGKLIMNGVPAKTPAAAVQKSIARYFRQNADH